MDIKLCSPSVNFKDSYLAGLAELDTDSDLAAWVYLGESVLHDFPKRDFNDYVKTLLNRETSPPEGYVPDSIYWAIHTGEVVGRISLRHELNDFLKRVGGHIGYIVRPSYRRKGVATEMLRQLLQTPKAKAVGKLLLTCDEDNIGSEKSILKNGGVFDALVDIGPDKPKKKHFWITLK